MILEGVQLTGGFPSLSTPNSRIWSHPLFRFFFVNNVAFEFFFLEFVWQLSCSGWWNGQLSNVEFTELGIWIRCSSCGVEVPLILQNLQKFAPGNSDCFVPKTVFKNGIIKCVDSPLLRSPLAEVGKVAKVSKGLNLKIASNFDFWRTPLIDLVRVVKHVMKSSTNLEVLKSLQPVSETQRSNYPKHVLCFRKHVSRCFGKLVRSEWSTDPHLFDGTSETYNWISAHILYHSKVNSTAWTSVLCKSTGDRRQIGVSWQNSIPGSWLKLNL